MDKKDEDLRNLNKKAQLLEKDLNKYKLMSKTDTDKHEKDLEVVEEKLTDARRNIDTIKKKLEQTESDLRKANGDKQTLMNDVSTLRREVNIMKETLDTATSKINAEKVKVEKELKEATLKIIRLQDTSRQNETKLKADVEDLERTLKKLREDLKSAVLTREDASKKLSDFLEGRDKELAGLDKVHQAEVAAKEQEKADLMAEWVEKEKQFLAEIARGERESESEVEKLKLEINDLRTKLVKKEDHASKLEKDKREMAITKDKTLKRMESVEKEKETIRESLSRLESEKKANNFGKYEKEKMKAELEKAMEERQKLASKLDSAIAENKALGSRVEEMGKCGEKTQQELESKNTSLVTQVAKLESECKSLQESLRIEKEKLKNLQAEMEDLSVKNLTLVADLSTSKSYEKEVRRLEEILQHKETECLSLNSKLIDLESVNDEAIVNRISSLEKETRELGEKAEEFLKEKSSLLEKIAVLEQEKQDLEAAKWTSEDMVANDLRSTQLQLQTVLSEKSQLEDKFEIERTSLLARVSQLEANSKTSPTSKTSKGKENGNKAVEDLRKVQIELQQVQVKYQKVEQEKTSLLARISSLESANKAKSVETANANKLGDDLKKSQAEGMKIQKELNALKKERDDLAVIAKRVTSIETQNNELSR